jgi:hypothetical protein
VSLGQSKQTLVKAKKRAGALPGLTVADGFMRHPFDVANGVRTSGLIAGRHLKSGHAHDRHATAYFGVAPSVFQSLMRRWLRSKPAAAVKDFTFIDLGAGMARAVLLASEMRFREVVGVELHPRLARIARHNVSLWRKAGRMQTATRIVCGDAVDFHFPPGPCLIFMFNPFGAPVMRRLLKRLASRFGDCPGSLDLLYVNNEQEAQIERQSGFRRLFVGQVRRSRADAIADHAILANQPDGEYASSNFEDCSFWRWTG